MTRELVTRVTAQQTRTETGGHKASVRERGSVALYDNGKVVVVAGIDSGRYTFTAEFSAGQLRAVADQIEADNVRYERVVINRTDEIVSLINRGLYKHAARTLSQLPEFIMRRRIERALDDRCNAYHYGKFMEEMEKV